MSSTSRPLVILGIIIIVIAIVAAVGYIMNGQSGTIQYGVASQTSSLASSSTATTGPSSSFYGSTSTPDMPDSGADSVSDSADSSGSPDSSTSISLASSTLDIPFPASTTIDTASWQIYVDPGHRYSIEHPSDLQMGTAGAGGLTLTFPKNTYFHWPLLDDVSFNVTVAAACPKLSDGATLAGAPTTFSLNGMTFTRTIGTDGVAGKRSLEVAYDTVSSGACYHLDTLDQGANGAGLYVDDASLIASYDAQHDADLSVVLSAMNGMVGNFHILAPTQ